MSWFRCRRKVPVQSLAGVTSHRDSSAVVSSASTLCLRRIHTRQNQSKKWVKNTHECVPPPCAISVRLPSNSGHHCSNDTDCSHPLMKHMRHQQGSRDHSRWSSSSFTPASLGCSSVSSFNDANNDESRRKSDVSSCHPSLKMHQQLESVRQWYKQQSLDVRRRDVRLETMDPKKSPFRRRKLLNGIRQTGHSRPSPIQTMSIYHRKSLVSTQNTTYLGTSVLLSAHPYSGSSEPPSSSKTKDGKTSAVSSSTSNKSWTRWLNPVFTVQKLGSMLFRMSYLIIDSVIHPSKGLDRLRNGWKHFVDELKHYWASTKLLASDVRVAAKIVRKMLRGYELSYRERRHLRRTALDMLRMVPFAFFIVIPFLEFLLPVVLILFPGLLPSTFRTKFQKAEARKRQLQLRLDLAKFMQETLTEFTDSLKKSKSDGEAVEKLSDIVEKVRLGQEVTNDEILKVSSLFDDHITLDNATNTELKNLCQYMGLSAFGPPALLRMRLHTRIRELRLEDRGIRKEGIDKIPEQLLKQLVRERGMRADLPENLLRENLNKWVELSLDYRVPTSLLFISRVFTIQHVPGEEITTLLKKKLEVASDTAYDEVLVEKAGVVDSAKEKAVLDRQTKLMQEEEQVNREQELAQKATEQALEDVDARAAAKGVLKGADTADSSSHTVSEKADEAAVDPASAYKDQRKQVEQSMSEARAALGRDAQTQTMEEQAAYKKKLLGTAEKLQAMMSESAVEHEQFELKHLMNKVKEAAVKLEEEHAQVLADGQSAVISDEMGEDIAQELGSSSPSFEASSLESAVESTSTMIDVDGKTIEDTAQVLVDDADGEVEYNEDQAQKEREQKEYEKAQKTKDKLSSKLDSMLGKLDSDIDATKTAIGNTMQVFESEDSVTYNEVGRVIREQMEQLQFSDEELDRVLHDLDLKGDDQLSKQEIDEVCRILRRELAAATDDETDLEDDDDDCDGQIKSLSNSAISSAASSSSSSSK